MVKQVKIERFKSISSATLDLSKINVLVGTNNAGKSSVLQALQFATSVAQTAKTYSQNVKFDKNKNLNAFEISSFSSFFCQYSNKPV